MDFLMVLFAKYLYLVVILGALVFAAFQKRPVQKKLLILSIISLPLIYLVAKIAGHFYFDPRPFVTHHLKPLIPHAATNGFPSDHALISFAVASLIFVFNKKIGLTLGLLGVLVGVSRVYVLIHLPIDIVGSLVISIVVVGVVDMLLSKYVAMYSGSHKAVN